jgi:hypothetical protein
MNTIIADTPDKINAYRVLALKSALRLEILGIPRSRRPSAYSIVKKEFGLHGSKKKVFSDLVDILNKRGIMVP